MDAAEFADVQRIRTGQTYSPLLIDNNITRMETLALRKGLNFVRVEPRITRNERGQAVDIEFAIVRGERIFVERIDIEGNATTLDQVIRRQFRTVEGDPFNPREIRQSAERIRALGFFSDAQVEAEPGSAPDQVVVNVDVEEQPTGSLEPWPELFGQRRHRDQPRVFGIELPGSRAKPVAESVDRRRTTRTPASAFPSPHFWVVTFASSFGAYYRTSENDNAFYDTRNIGITDAAIGFPVGEQAELGLNLRFSEDRLSDVGRGQLADPAA